MKKLICINPKNYKLTLDKEYSIVIDEGETVLLINDNNKTVRYYKDLFQEIEEEIEIIPEPEPVAVRTEQDLIDSITNDGIVIKYINFNNEEVVVENYLDIISNTNSFSCGIKNLTGIGDQIAEIYNIIENEELNFAEDLELFTKALIKQYFKNFIKYKINDGFNGGIYLMSCNINEGGLNEETVDILDEISDFNTIPELNPNSGNLIKLWGFYKSNLDN